MEEKQIKNMKINRVTFLIAGVIFLLFGIFFIPFLIVGVLLILLAYKTNKTYKEALNVKVEVKPEIDPESKEEIKKPVTETVKVMDLDGSVRELSINLCLDEKNRVLVTEGGKTYHTYLNCHKNWKPEMIENFKGWKIVKKSEATAKGMRYCSFCEGKDRIPDTDMDDLEEYESEYEEE